MLTLAISVLALSTPADLYFGVPEDTYLAVNPSASVSDENYVAGKTIAAGKTRAAFWYYNYTSGTMTREVLPLPADVADDATTSSVAVAVAGSGLVSGTITYLSGGVVKSRFAIWTYTSSTHVHTYSTSWSLQDAYALSGSRSNDMCGASYLGGDYAKPQPLFKSGSNDVTVSSDYGWATGVSIDRHAIFVRKSVSPGGLTESFFAKSVYSPTSYAPADTWRIGFWSSSVTALAMDSDSSLGTFVTGVRDGKAFLWMPNLSTASGVFENVESVLPAPSGTVTEANMNSSVGYDVSRSGDVVGDLFYKTSGIDDSDAFMIQRSLSGSPATYTYLPLDTTFNSTWRQYWHLYHAASIGVITPAYDRVIVGRAIGCTGATSSALAYTRTSSEMASRPCEVGDVKVEVPYFARVNN